MVNRKVTETSKAALIIKVACKSASTSKSMSKSTTSRSSEIENSAEESKVMVTMLKVRQDTAGCI